MIDDLRTYIVDHDWRPASKQDPGQLLCHHIDSEEGYYHRIGRGEIYLACGTEVLCINCAVKRGIVTVDRPSLKASRFAPEARISRPTPDED